MPNFRKQRVAELLKQVISDIVAFQSKDPRLEGITITDVRMAGDLKSANVYFSCLADGRPEAHQEGLEAAEGFIRTCLRKEVDLKYIPKLEFRYDTSFDYYDKIDRLLKGLHEPEESNESGNIPDTEE